MDENSWTNINLLISEKKAQFIKTERNTHPILLTSAQAHHSITPINKLKNT